MYGGQPGRGLFFLLHFFLLYFCVSVFLWFIRWEISTNAWNFSEIGIIEIVFLQNWFTNKNKKVFKILKTFLYIFSKCNFSKYFWKVSLNYSLKKCSPCWQNYFSWSKKKVFHWNEKNFLLKKRLAQFFSTQFFWIFFKFCSNHDW